MVIKSHILTPCLFQTNMNVAIEMHHYALVPVQTP